MAIPWLLVGLAVVSATSANEYDEDYVPEEQTIVEEEVLPDENSAWLERNAHKAGVITLPSGLQYKVLASGPKTGERPGATDECTCHYEGAAPSYNHALMRVCCALHRLSKDSPPWPISVLTSIACPHPCAGSLIDGSVFDSSRKRGRPATFSPDQVIKGWTEALQMMRPGDRWMLYIPASLGYGHRGGGGGAIPSGATLIFDLELFSSEGALFPSVGIRFLDMLVFGPIKLWMVISMTMVVVCLFAVVRGRGHISKSVTASHILVKTEEEALCAQLKEQLTSGQADFAALAKQHSVCPTGKFGGLLGTFKPDDIMPQQSNYGRTLEIYVKGHRGFEQICWNAPIGQLQGPMQTQFGWHLIVITGRSGMPMPSVVPDDKDKKVK
jgi:FKBP-type peptidyl-prolyl cis-trans isomerase